MRVTLTPFWAKTILRFNPFKKLIVVCKGYDGDDENFTELVWPDDKYMDFCDREWYPKFELWLLK